MKINNIKNGIKYQFGKLIMETLKNNLEKNFF